MKKMIAVFVMVLVFAMTGMTSMAATPRQYEDYEAVKNGFEEYIATYEDEDTTIISVEKKEYPTERECTYRVRFTDSDGTYTMLYYVNGQTEEVVAIVWDEDGDVYDTGAMNLSDAAELYSK